MESWVKDGSDLALALGVLIGAFVQLLNCITQRENAKKIEKLATNTDGIKDALVLVTGQAEHAKGVLAGREQAAAHDGDLIRKEIDDTLKIKP